ncbi:MAG: glutamate 5-kinase, partial [Myxococcota bacterium]
MEPRALHDARRVVVKVGTSVVTRPDGRLAVGRLGALAEGVAALHAQGRQVLLVSSGAIGLGVEQLGFPRRPRSLVDQQACAAAGQGTLVTTYDHVFSRLGLKLAQVLLTEDDFHRRERYVSLARTLERLLALGAVPLINENDVVATQHLSVFGDNDRLAALVATHLACDALVLLTDVDAVRTAPPGEPGSERIAVMTDDRAVTLGPASAGGTGGMHAKIRAARLAAREGVTAVIASGFAPDALTRVMDGDDVGTRFEAAGRRRSRQRWLSLATVQLGTLHVNEGARRALV